MSKMNAINAREVAVLVKCIKNIDAAADLIDQYARTVAAGAKIDATTDAYDRIFAQLDRQFGSKAKT